MRAQEPGNPSVTAESGSTVRFLKFVAGAGIGLGLHEAGHLAFDWAFDAKPRLKRVEFGGIPFPALVHRTDLSPRRELTISSAGFWTQYLASEHILFRRPHLRAERAAVLKGVLAFQILTSAGYAAAALARAGPAERDTRGMAISSGIDERAIGVLVLAPAVLDAYRYVRPDARWAVWVSRAAKIGTVGLLLR